VVDANAVIVADVEAAEAVEPGGLAVFFVSPSVARGLYAVDWGAGAERLIEAGEWR